ncbi:MAG TPA: hypothetical protein VHE34_08260 [Puia sp.]|uniref:hypothetical protein n=1 Tax=Puia sp. TaxID=2045100 RepID=UPI002B884109|nr:hypothetical protein [Puia sp.]HVU95201.1 hypothetical protein [Puia sp.]
MGRFSGSALISALLLIGQWASGQGPEAAVAGGFQSMNLRWSIAGNSAGRWPNVYSELRWRRVGGVSADAVLRYGVGRRWVLFGEGLRLFTSTGRVSDRDYSQDNRNGVQYSGDFSGGGGYGYSIGAGAGYRLWPGSRFELVPAVGYGVSGQHLTITDPGGLYDFLNSYYQTSWYGPFFRALALWSSGRWRVSGMVTYHQVSYRAKADWNLIADFDHPVSFRHRADGFGIEGECRAGYRVCTGLEVFAAMSGNVWETGIGIDELYRSGGATQQTQLNEVIMTGFGLRAGVRVGLSSIAGKGAFDRR